MLHNGEPTFPERNHKRTQTNLQGKHNNKSFLETLRTMVCAMWMEEQHKIRQFDVLRR